MSEKKPIDSHKVVLYDKSNRKRFFKGMYNFSKIWQQVKEKFFSIYIYIWWTDHLLSCKLNRSVTPIYWLYFNFVQLSGLNAFEIWQKYGKC